MSIRKPSQSAANREARGLTARPTQMRSGFTLIELLVVVAIIALLISILLPSLSSAREQARAVVCAQSLRQLATGLQTYAGENRDYIPGLNTSGVAVSAKRFAMGGNPSVLYQSKMAVQTYDWMTPILAPGMEMPALRSERFKFLLEKFRCPSQMYTAVVYESADGPDLDEFWAQGPVPASSYKMPAHFQFVGQSESDQRIGSDERIPSIPILAKSGSPTWEVVVPNYIPRLDRVGPSARKIFAAEGTRYLDESQLLDYDPSPIPNWFGAFSAAGGWWSGCPAYGVAPGSINWDGMPVAEGSLSGGMNLAVTYRHGLQRGSLSGDPHQNSGAINAAFFDGHVQRMSDRQSREPQMWYPTGAVVKVPSEGMTNLPVDFVLP